MALKILYFVHGTTYDNEEKLASGWNDVGLSPLGLKQAKELKTQKEDISLDCLYCSDLKRAIDTAALAFENKLTAIQDDRLREIDYGDFTQAPVASFKHLMENYVKQSYPNGESYLQVLDRMASFLKESQAKYPNGHIGIVAHQAPQLVLEVLTNGKTWQEAITSDWRLAGDWQPGWNYTFRDES